MVTIALIFESKALWKTGFLDRYKLISTFYLNTGHNWVSGGLDLKCDENKDQTCYFCDFCSAIYDDKHLVDTVLKWLEIETTFKNTVKGHRL